MNRTNRNGRAARGAATVEMALSMVVFIPIFMYALFLDDLLRYSLDAQEAALSTVWDFTIQDYNKNLKKEAGNGKGPMGGSTQVQHNARLTFCDHESGANRTGSDDDCKDTNHHKAVVAHVCWMNDEARQVTCEEPKREIGALNGPLASAYDGEFTKGGYIECSARAVVENYLLPETFLPQFSKGEKLSKENWKEKGVSRVHDNAEEGTSDNAYFLKAQQLAIVTDSWALTEQADLSPTSTSGEMFKRVELVYEKADGYIRLQTSFPKFRSGLTKELLNDMYLKGVEDTPLRPYLSIHPHLSGTPMNGVEQEGERERYFNQEWRDWDADKNQKTYQHSKRGDWYMGCKDAESC